uniref:Uncharacterized protein n=3 Tax=Anopheles marajoara TaxID=58244 RepID=A0A2M4BN37_9DIPT
MAKIALGLVPASSAASESSGTGSLSASSSSSSSNDPQSGSRSTETGTTGAGGGHIVSSVAKRGRLLIRQQRIKKESDSSSSGQQPYEPDTPSDDNSPTAIVYGQQHLLTVPSAHHRFERQVSEPIMPLSASGASSVIGGPISSSGGDGRQGHERSTATASGHLLSVPSHQPYLVKQHSHPLLPSQTSSAISHTAITGHQSFQTITSYTLQRQLSHPATVGQTPLTLVTSSSGSTHYLTPSSSLKTDSDEEGGSNVTVTLSTTTSSASSSSSSSTTTTNTNTTTIIPTIQLQPIGDRPPIEGSPTVVVVPADPVPVTTTCPVSSSNSGSGQSTITSITSTPTSSIRVKGEELSRSISTPLTSSRSSDIPGLDNPRSSHCPVVREGPALGCNFCWNTIDAHGRILRRKTKYHCPECQTNLCIVPCFQEYHERQSAENSASTGDGSSSGGGGSGSSVTKSGLRHYAKSGSM